jgi:hypothetical protein
VGNGRADVSVGVSVSASVSSGDLSSVALAKEETAELKKPSGGAKRSPRNIPPASRALKVCLNAGANLISVS